MLDDIEVHRTRIQELDGGIIRLLGERFAHVRRVGHLKESEGLPVEDPSREDELRRRYLDAAGRMGLDPALVLEVFEVVLEHSRRQQRRLRKSA